MLTDCEEPSCYVEAMLRDDKLKWERAMQSKMDSLHKNATWDLVQLSLLGIILQCRSWHMYIPLHSVPIKVCPISDAKWLCGAHSV